MGKNRRGSDTESGEEKEMMSRSEWEYLQTLPEIERERIIDQKKEEQLRARQVQQVSQLVQEQSFAPVHSPIDSDEEERIPRKKRSRMDEDYVPRKKRATERATRYESIREQTEVGLEDIERIRISRDQLAKWLHHLYFEKTVKGAFVRINIGRKQDSQKNVYIMCEIVDVTTQDSYYEIRDKRMKTNKMLVLANGKTKKTLKMDVVSNERFEPSEFEAYKTRLMKDGLKIVTQEEIKNKEIDIQAAYDYKYTSEELDQLLLGKLEEDLRRGKIGVSATLELEKLKVQLEELKANVDIIDPEIYTAKRQNLEDLVRKVENAISVKDKPLESEIILKLNERNRTRQLEIDSQRARNLISQEKEAEMEIDDEPSTLSYYEKIQVSIQKLVDLHTNNDLGIEHLIDNLNHVDVRPEHPCLVKLYPGTSQYVLEDRPTNAKIISIDDWKAKR